MPKAAKPRKERATPFYSHTPRSTVINPSKSAGSLSIGRMGAFGSAPHRINQVKGPYMIMPLTQCCSYNPAVKGPMASRFIIKPQNARLFSSP